MAYEASSAVCSVGCEKVLQKYSGSRGSLAYIQMPADERALNIRVRVRVMIKDRVILTVTVRLG